MWLFSRYGFFSAVNARLNGTGQASDRTLPADPDRILIRARVRSHLDNLVARFPERLRSIPIDEDAIGKRDYRFMMIVPKWIWTGILFDLGDEMDYPKFKPSVIDFEGKEEYQKALLDVWYRMYATQ